MRHVTHDSGPPDEWTLPPPPPEPPDGTLRLYLNPDAPNRLALAKVFVRDDETSHDLSAVYGHPDNRWFELGASTAPSSWEGLCQHLGAENLTGLHRDTQRLEREVAEHRALFDLQWRRMAEATGRWRAENPEARALIMPDLGYLLRWLMDDADRARNGGWYLGPCGNQREPDGTVCTADLYAAARTDVQVQCPKCGAWTGAAAPSRPGTRLVPDDVHARRCTTGYPHDELP